MVFSHPSGFTNCYFTRRTAVLLVFCLNRVSQRGNRSFFKGITGNPLDRDRRQRTSSPLYAGSRHVLKSFGDARHFDRKFRMDIGLT